MLAQRVSFVFSMGIAASLGCGTTHKANWAEKPVTKEVSADQAAAADALVAEGDALWAERATKEKLVAGLAKWEEAMKAKPTADLAVKLARGHYLLGDGHYVLEEKEDLRDAEYQKGLDNATLGLKLAAPAFAAALAADKGLSDALAAVPNEPAANAALYWHAANLGKWAASKGFATRLKYKDDIKTIMLLVKSRDELFFHAAPWRYFGAFEAATSGLAGGSLDKSDANFKKAVELAPYYLGNKVLWAEYYCTKKQDKAKYKTLLEEVLAANPDEKADADVGQENRVEQLKAKRLLARIDDEF